MKTPAIYFIKNNTNGKIYIGSSQHWPRRLWEHRYFLRNKSHYNTALQKAWNKYGEPSFEFGVIEKVEDKNSLLDREQYWIDFFSSADGKSGYNLCPAAGTRKGVPQPATVGLKMRAVHSGKPKSAEQRLKMSLAAKGRKKSPEHREKLRQAAIKQFSDPEARERAREIAIRQFSDPAQREAARARATGRKHTAEARLKMRATRLCMDRIASIGNG